MKMEIGCCGAVCEECELYPNECEGCSEIKGKAFWLKYTNEPICVMYDCCVNDNRLPHCGKCPKFPCEKCTCDDPRMTPEENKKVRDDKIVLLGLLSRV